MICKKCQRLVSENEVIEANGLCTSCSSKIKSENQPDYYYENGWMVFTEHYHLKRGYCCKHGCRHCPWKEK